MTVTQKGRKSMTKKILPITAALCAVAVIAMILALTFGGKQKTTEFSPPPFDSTAQEGTPDVPQNARYGEMDAKLFTFSAAGELTVKGGKTDVWFTNPSENSVWMKIRIMDADGNILGESGLI